MTTATKKRVFTFCLVKGSKPTDLCRMELDHHPFEGSSLQDERRPAGSSYRVLSLADAAAIVNADIKAGLGLSPLTQYVDSI